MAKKDEKEKEKKDEKEKEKKDEKEKEKKEDFGELVNGVKEVIEEALEGSWFDKVLAATFVIIVIPWALLNTKSGGNVLAVFEKILSIMFFASAGVTKKIFGLLKIASECIKKGVVFSYPYVRDPFAWMWLQLHRVVMWTPTVVGMLTIIGAILIIYGIAHQYYNFATGVAVLLTFIPFLLSNFLNKFRYNVKKKVEVKKGEVTKIEKVETGEEKLYPFVSLLLRPILVFAYFVYFVSVVCITLSRTQIWGIDFLFPLVIVYFFACSYYLIRNKASDFFYTIGFWIAILLITYNSLLSVYQILPADGFVHSFGKMMASRTDVATASNEAEVASSEVEKKIVKKSADNNFKPFPTKSKLFLVDNYGAQIGEEVGRCQTLLIDIDQTAIIKDLQAAKAKFKVGNDIKSEGYIYLDDVDVDGVCKSTKSLPTTFPPPQAGQKEGQFILQASETEIRTNLVASPGEHWRITAYDAPIKLEYNGDWEWMRDKVKIPSTMAEWKIRWTGEATRVYIRKVNNK